MELKVVSDGTSAGTRVVTEDGELVDWIMSIRLEKDYDSPNTQRATITFLIVDTIPIHGGRVDGGPGSRGGG